MNLNDLSNLRHLIALRAAVQPESVLEEVGSAAALDGIRAIVTDALGDLEDKLGEDGVLATLMADSGADKLDTVKDADGFTVMKRLTTRVDQFKKEVEKLLVEAEVLISQVNEE